jgi:transmembrane sensor
MYFFSNGVSLEQLIQCIEGNADESVRQLVEEWISKDQQHRVFFGLMKESWSQLSDIKVLDRKSVENDMNKVLKEIRKFGPGVSSGTLLVNNEKWYQKTWLKVAAIFIIVIAFAGGFFFKQHSRSVNYGSIVYNEITIPFGQKSRLVLSDGTKIWINSGTKLRFPNRFENKAREVWLEGEAFFEVAKDASKPFYVHTGDLNIKVLGTTFNVKAYGDDGITETALVNGHVSIQQVNTNGKTESEVKLEPYRKAIYIKNESLLNDKEIKKQVSEPLQLCKIIVTGPVNLEPIISWTEDKMVFEDEPFRNIAKRLERRYGMQIIIDNNNLREYRYTGILKKISVEQAIKAIQLTAKFNYTVVDNKLTITN